MLDTRTKSLNLIHSGAQLGRDIGNLGQFGHFATACGLRAFTSGPWFFVLLPLVGISLLGLTVIEWLKLWRAPNRNFDTWVKTILMTISTLIANTSIWTSVSMAILGLGSFTLGPYLFVASLSLGALYLVGITILNGLRSLAYPLGSEERKHYGQQALGSLQQFTINATVIALIVAALIIGAAPPVLIALATLSISLIVMSNIWHYFVPTKMKSDIANFIWPQQQPSKEITESVCIQPSKPDKQPDNTFSLFQRPYRLQEIKKFIYKNELKSAKLFLIQELGNKIDYLKTRPQDRKHKDKLSLAQELLSVLDKNLVDSLESYLSKWPQSLQSLALFSGKGDMEDLYESVVYYCEQNQIISQPLLAATSLGY